MKLVRIFLALLYGASFCDAGTLDDLVAYEQINVDNEAVAAYGGKVGKLDAIFLIEWDGEPNNTLTGYYYYPSRGQHLKYRLSGTNPKPGVIVLQEFTPKADGGEFLSASCRLTKRVTAGRVVWEGTMNNTDGRVLSMSFSRKNKATHFAEEDTTTSSESNQNAGKISSSFLTGYWETTNINAPFNEREPKLSMRFLTDGTLIADEETNRERRGTWTLQGENIIETLSNARYANRILDFNEKQGSMVLSYEMYANKPLQLRKVR